MRGILPLLALVFGIYALSDVSLAGQRDKTKSVHVQKKKAYKTAKKKVRVRFAHSVNSPKEGEQLKLDAIARDLNE